MPAFGEDHSIMDSYMRNRRECDGMRLLNIIVCAACASMAKSLRLRTEKIGRERMVLAAPHERFLA